MPVINGKKVACEPCIRGHRSTKCSHANERVMIPVRKPGRPLSACPHNGDGEACGCGSFGVTVAIPRTQKCGCGTDDSPVPPPAKIVASRNEPRVKLESQTPGPETPTSPTRNGFRVQKPSSRQPTRKQSIDPATIVRMDAANVNIMPSYASFASPPIPVTGSVSLNGIPAEQVMSSFGFVSQAPMVNGYGQPINVTYVPMNYAMAPQHSLGPVHSMATTFTTIVEQPPIATNGVSAFNHASHTSSRPNGIVSEQGVISTATSSPLQAANPSMPPPQASSDNHVTNGSSTPSCCGPAEVAPKQTLPPRVQQTPTAQQPFSAYQEHPTVYAFPPQYGSMLHPLQPAEWKDSMASYSQPEDGDRHATASPMPYFNDSSHEAMATIHPCGCGDGCECLGCMAHPYNAPTKDLVFAAWSVQNESLPADLYRGAAMNGSDGTNGYHHSPVIDVTPGPDHLQQVPQQADGPAASPQAQTPSSDATSALSEEQTLNPNDYFFVNYPFGGESCVGDGASCACGDGCQCLGCTIHNNSLPELTDDSSSR